MFIRTMNVRSSAADSADNACGSGMPRRASGESPNRARAWSVSLFDQPMITTPGGRAFLHTLAGPAGDELADNYVKVLAATGVKGYPYVKAAPHAKPGSEDAPVGVRVDETELRNLNAYLAKMAILNASERGEKRGIALPLLLDLARKPVFLHDNSVPSLDRLLDATRGPNAPHPFYLPDQGQRAAIIAYLQGLGTDASPPR